MIDIKEKTQCCGCASCVQRCPKQCISLKEDTEGFLYPVVDKENCIDCGLCERVCPILHRNKARTPLKVYAAKHMSEEIRMKSSSGGIFTLLAEQILNEGGVVFGARFDESWDVIHDYTETKDGLKSFRGSKYVQSRISYTFKKVESFLKDGRMVMFTATPCQIAGLKSFLRKEYDNLLAVDIVCHGVPSPLVWREYLQYTKKKEEITSINFRDKTESWKEYRMNIKGKNNLIVKESFFYNIYMRGFLKDLYLRPSCYNCSFKSNRSDSDITLGDFWGINHHMPDFDDDKGVSLVLLQSQKGIEYYNSVAPNHIETEYNIALAGNPAIEQSAKCNLKYRKLFWCTEDKIGDMPYIISSMRPSIIRRGFGFMKHIINKIITKMKLG